MFGAKAVILNTERPRTTIENHNFQVRCIAHIAPVRTRILSLVVWKLGRVSAAV